MPQSPAPVRHYAVEASVYDTRTDTHARYVVALTTRPEDYPASYGYTVRDELPGDFDRLMDYQQLLEDTLAMESEPLDATGHPVNPDATDIRANAAEVHAHCTDCTVCGAGWGS